MIGTTHAELFALSKSALEQAVAEYPKLKKKLNSEMRLRQAQRESRGEVSGEVEEPTSITPDHAAQD